MNDIEYQGVGKVTSIQQRETRSGKEYTVTWIDGMKYSVWRPEMLEGVDTGDFVTYKWRDRNGFKNLYSIEKVDAPPESNSSKRYSIPSDDQLERMCRMSALKSATQIVGRMTDGSPEDRKTMALTFAQEFEQYIFARPGNVQIETKEEPPKKRTRKKKGEPAQIQTIIDGAKEDLPF
jgi:hypothetical protein